MTSIVKKQNWIVITVVAAMLVGGVVSCGSGPVKAIIDHKVENWAEWTPETIRKYPTEWLMSAQRDLSEKQMKLKVSRTGIRRNQIRWEGSYRISRREATDLSKYLDKAKEKYRKADRNNAWPIYGWPLFRGDKNFGESYDRKRFQKIIVTQHRAKGRADRRMETYKKMAFRAESMVEKIGDKQHQINEVLLDLDLAIELAKAAEQMTDLTGLSDRGREIQVTVKALMEELDRAFDNQSLPAMNRSLNDEFFFEEIMRKSEARKAIKPAVHVVAREAK